VCRDVNFLKKSKAKAKRKRQIFKNLKRKRSESENFENLLSESEAKRHGNFLSESEAKRTYLSLFSLFSLFRFFRFFAFFAFSLFSLFCFFRYFAFFAFSFSASFFKKRILSDSINNMLKYSLKGNSRRFFRKFDENDRIFSKIPQIPGTFSGNGVTKIAGKNVKN
jgi:hypothetical protein